MKTVRVKLVLLVLACMAPALAGAVLRSYESERDLLEQVTRRVNGSARRFGTELDEYQSNAKLALSLVEHAVKFHQALATHDAAGADRMVKTLTEVYQHRIILASDDHGVVLAKGNAKRGPASLGPEASPAFAGLLAGQSLTGMIEVQYTDGPGYAMVNAAPVRADDVQVGAIALLTPITAEYLEYLEPKLNADLSVRVNEKVVAACADYPAPNSRVARRHRASLKEVGGKLFALKTFRPEKLQRAGMEVELTASRDVTELRDEARKDLHRELGYLVVALIVVCSASRSGFASRMGGAVRLLLHGCREGQDGQVRERSGAPYR